MRPAAGILADESLEAWLVDRNLALLQALDFGGVDIDAHHVIAGFRQTSARHEADVA